MIFFIFFAIEHDLLFDLKLVTYEMNLVGPPR